MITANIEATINGVLKETIKKLETHYNRSKASYKKYNADRKVYFGRVQAYRMSIEEINDYMCDEDNKSPFTTTLTT